MMLAASTNNLSGNKPFHMVHWLVTFANTFHKVTSNMDRSHTMCMMGLDTFRLGKHGHMGKRGKFDCMDNLEDKVGNLFH